VQTLARSTTPPVATRPVWRRATVARVSGLDGWLRARSPFYGLPCDAPRSIDPDAYRPTSASHCFDYEHPRLIGSRHLFEAFASPLGHAFCAQTHETGGPGVSRRPIRFGGSPGLVRGVFFRALPNDPCLWHPCRFPIRRRRAFARAGFLGLPRPRGGSPREDEISHGNPRCLPSMGDTRAPSCVGRRPEPISSSGHVMGFRSDSALGAPSLTAAALRFWRPLHRL